MAMTRLGQRGPVSRFSFPFTFRATRSVTARIKGMKQSSLRVVRRKLVYFTTLLLGSLFVIAGCHDEQSTKSATTTPVAESACQDGEDNDADGLSDCDDSDCQSPGGECKAAPDLDRTVATTLFEAAPYLYTGKNPLQKGVDASAIDRRQVAMLRGRAIDADGAPLAGAKITVKGHKEFGYTYSRGDGFYDLVVNGGSRLVLDFELAGHLSVQRAVHPGWQRYVTVADAGMIAASTRSTQLE